MEILFHNNWIFYLFVSDVFFFFDEGTANPYQKLVKQLSVNNQQFSYYSILDLKDARYGA